MRRILQVLLAQHQNRLRHGGGEQRRLARLGRLLQNRLDVVAEAHVQHLVGLVQHRQPDAGEIQRAAPHVIHHAARRADHHLHAPAQLPQLALDGRAAVHRQHRYVPVLAQLHQLAGGLQRQLPRGRQHDGLHAPVRRVDLLHQRNAEGRRLARARLRLADHVPPLQHGRNRVPLNRRGLLEAHLRHGLTHLL